MLDQMEAAKNLKSKQISSKKKDQKNDGCTYKCSQCEENFSSIGAKRKHERHFHLVLKPFLCECGQQFGKLSEVNYHIRRIHNKEKNFICQICSKGFFKNSDLVSHLSTHETSGKFMCKDCGRRFKHVSNLIRHSRTHTGVKPYPCSVCNKRFSQIAALRQHQLTEEHKSKLAELIKNEKLKTENNNKTDVSLNDGQNESKSRKWWFYCKVCGERFQYSVLLRDHEIKHVSNKDVKCSSCMKNFSSVKELNNHSCFVSTKEGPTEVDSNSLDTRQSDEQILEEENLNLDLLSTLRDKMDPSKNEITENDNSPDKDKKIELTLSQNGQIMLDNDEVLLTLNDKVYGLLLINNDVTILENDEYLQVLNNKPQDLFTEVVDDSEKNSEIGNVFNIDSHPLESSGVNENRLSDMENWLWNQRTLDIQNENEITNFESGRVEETIEAVADLDKKSKNVNTFTCSECGKVFNKKGNYQQHLGIHFIKMQKHKCPECQRVFAWKSTLRKHIVKAHGEQMQYPCKQCGKIYHSSILVQHHIKRDHMNIRSHKCTYCGKSFFRKYDLKIHTRVHTDERPYICGVCGKRFRHLSHSIRHDKIHLRKEPEEEESSKVIGVIMFNNNTLAV